MNTLATATILAATLATAAGAVEPLNALLITGQQNHDWVYTSDIHRKTLEQSGRFRVDVTTQAPRSLLDAQGLKKYQVFVLDYNGPRRARPRKRTSSPPFQAAPASSSSTPRTTPSSAGANTRRCAA